MPFNPTDERVMRLVRSEINRMLASQGQGLGQGGSQVHCGHSGGKTSLHLLLQGQPQSLLARAITLGRKEAAAAVAGGGQIQ
jgi:hypothetical protein